MTGWNPPDPYTPGKGLSRTFQRSFLIALKLPQFWEKSIFLSSEVRFSWKVDLDKKCKEKCPTIFRGLKIDFRCPLSFFQVVGYHSFHLPQELAKSVIWLRRCLILKFLVPPLKKYTMEGSHCEILDHSKNLHLQPKRLGYTPPTHIPMKRAYQGLSNGFFGLLWSCLSFEKNRFFWAPRSDYLRKIDFKIWTKMQLGAYIFFPSDFFVDLIWFLETAYCGLFWGIWVGGVFASLTCRKSRFCGE